MTGLPMGHWGGERKRERERKDLGLISNRNFLKVSYGNSKNCEHQSCKKFKSIQLLCWANFYLSYGLKDILNFQKQRFKECKFLFPLLHFNY